jgi:hypothetical protein
MADLRDLIFRRNNLEIDRELIEAGLETANLRLRNNLPGAAAEVNRLNAQLRQVDSALVTVNRTISQQSPTTSNPPNPQVPTPAVTPPPPPLTRAPTAANNPPNPQVPSAAVAPVSTSEIVVAPNTIRDDAVGTGQGDPLVQLDDVTILETNSQINTAPQDVDVTDVTTDPDDGVVEFEWFERRLSK